MVLRPNNVRNAALSTKLYTIYVYCLSWCLMENEGSIINGSLYYVIGHYG